MVHIDGDGSCWRVDIHINGDRADWGYCMLSGSHVRSRRTEDLQVPAFLTAGDMEKPEDRGGCSKSRPIESDARSGSSSLGTALSGGWRITRAIQDHDDNS